MALHLTWAESRSRRWNHSPLSGSALVREECPGVSSPYWGWCANEAVSPELEMEQKGKKGNSWTRVEYMEVRKCTVSVEGSHWQGSDQKRGPQEIGLPVTVTAGEKTTATFRYLVWFSREILKEAPHKKWSSVCMRQIQRDSLPSDTVSTFLQLTWSKTWRSENWNKSIQDKEWLCWRGDMERPHTTRERFALLQREPPPAPGEPRPPPAHTATLTASPDWKRGA